MTQFNPQRGVIYPTLTPIKDLNEVGSFSDIHITGDDVIFSYDGGTGSSQCSAC